MRCQTTILASKRIWIGWYHGRWYGSYVLMQTNARCFKLAQTTRNTNIPWNPAIPEVYFCLQNWRRIWGWIWTLHLNFSKHTEIQVNKANRILGLIRRSYEFLDGESLKRLYMALVRPHLEYCKSVCFPRLIKDKKPLEGVQRRATKLIPDLSNLPYEERLKKLDMPSLQYRRHRGDMIEVYKIVHGFYGVNVDVLPRETATATRGHTFKLKKSQDRGTVARPQRTRQAFFSYSTGLWMRGILYQISWLPHPLSVYEVWVWHYESIDNSLDRVWSQYKYETHHSGAIIIA